MSIYDRDYMKRKPDEDASSDTLEDRAQNFASRFLRSYANPIRFIIVTLIVLFLLGLIMSVVGAK